MINHKNSSASVHYISNESINSEIHSLDYKTSNFVMSKKKRKNKCFVKVRLEHIIFLKKFDMSHYLLRERDSYCCSKMVFCLQRRYRLLALCQPVERLLHNLFSSFHDDQLLIEQIRLNFLKEIHLSS